VLVAPPICPDALSPQQYAIPAAVTPQVWSAGPLVLMAVKVTPPETATGTGLSVVDPLPS